VWKFEAENIGKVGHAEISMAPLVLLVGRNNTGKSYIATLLWALMNAQTLISRDDASDHRPEWCKAFIAQIDRKEPGKVEVTEELAGELIKHFNYLLGQNGRELLRGVFAYKGFEQSSIHVEADQPFLPFNAEVLPVADSAESAPFFARFRIVNAEVVDSTRLRIEAPPRLLLRQPRLTDRIVTELIYRVLLGPRNRRQTLYIPAARTGLMLSLPVIITQLFTSDSPAPVRLPRPLREFLRRLTFQPPPLQLIDSKQEEIATWLQNEIMHGKIEVSNDAAPSITYVPENTTTSLHAKAYEFSETGDKTAVFDVKKELEGFVVPSLNDTLTSLAKETMALNEGEE
jgi:hypothetical protein